MKHSNVGLPAREWWLNLKTCWHNTSCCQLAREPLTEIINISWRAVDFAVLMSAECADFVSEGVVNPDMTGNEDIEAGDLGEEEVELSAANPYAALQRRQVGKREWRAALTELLESESDDLVRLRSLRNRHSQDGETQRLVAELHESKTSRVLRLNELLHYREKEHGNGGDA